MARILSVLATLLVLTIFQVVSAAAAAEPPTTKFYLNLGDYYLATPDGAQPDSIVRLTRDLETAALWDLVYDDIHTGTDKRYVINLGDSNLTLSYDRAEPKAELKLKIDADRRWVMVIDGGVELQTVERFEDRPLVIGIIPGDVEPPAVGLVLARQSGTAPGLEVQTTRQARHMYMMRIRYQKMLSR
ncbi:hypothetical protein DFQ26_005798 [Actinomortierella ambigua]|nr:hypothetical protein DFQ26_005798 [Actinomortierella ambigua]